MVKTKKKIGILIGFAVIFIGVGFTLSALWPPFFQGKMEEELVLSPNSTSYKMWKETPVPMYLKIYLYNWTNSDKIGAKPYVKPHFVQTGPYVFREVDIKDNKVWNKANGTVTFQQRRVWTFVPEMSKGLLTDSVTNLNPVAATVAYSVRHRSNIFKGIVSAILRRLEKITITKTVKELLFDGYDDLLLKTAVELNLTQIPYERFAWFYNRNNSASFDGTFNILTGSTNMYETGILQNWNYNSISPAHSSCGKVSGSLGDLWPPVGDKKIASVFSPDICTTIDLTAAGTDYWLGVKGSRFISEADMLDNGTNVESRKCYCKDVDCQPSGTLNVSLCKYGAPAFVSLPHFYLADESYRESITGMNPKKEDHECELLLQPDTGVPLKVRASLQINFLIQPDRSLSYFKDLSTMYIPMLWFTQEVHLTQEYASQVKLLVLLPPLVSGILYSIGAIGILLVVVSIILYYRQRKKDEQNEILIPKDTRQEDKNPEEAIINEE